MRASWLAIALFTAGCVVAAVGPPPPRVEVLVADARFGGSAGEVLGHPDLGPRIRALFGADWQATATARGGTATPAGDFFGRAEAPRRVEIDGQPYVALTGCAPAACRTHRGLLLIQADGAELRARLDEAGYTRYYAFGPGAVVDPPTRALLDAAWRALPAGG
jgi:hypothetical protein